MRLLPGKENHPSASNGSAPAPPATLIPISLESAIASNGDRDSGVAPNRIRSLQLAASDEQRELYAHQYNQRQIGVRDIQNARFSDAILFILLFIITTEFFFY